MSLGKTVHVLSPKMAGIGQVVLEVRAAIVSYINSSFLAKFRFPVTQEDETLLKTFTITKLSVRETELSSSERVTEGIIRKVPFVRSSKQVIVLIFIFL